jgi:hypothetical protein
MQARKGTTALLELLSTEGTFAHSSITRLVQMSKLAGCFGAHVTIQPEKSWCHAFAEWCRQNTHSATLKGLFIPVLLDV